MTYISVFYFEREVKFFKLNILRSWRQAQVKVKEGSWSQIYHNEAKLMFNRQLRVDNFICWTIFV